MLLALDQNLTWTGEGVVVTVVVGVVLGGVGVLVGVVVLAGVIVDLVLIVVVTTVTGEFTLITTINSYHLLAPLC